MYISNDEFQHTKVTFDIELKYGINDNLLSELFSLKAM